MRIQYLNFKTVNQIITNFDLANFLTLNPSYNLDFLEAQIPSFNLLVPLLPAL